MNSLYSERVMGDGYTIRKYLYDGQIIVFCPDGRIDHVAQPNGDAVWYDLRGSVYSYATAANPLIY